MEGSSSRSRIGGSPASQLLQSRRGGITIAIGAAALAGVLLFIFVQQYRNSVNNKAALVPVFVASGFIPHGTPASLIASEHLLQRTAMKKNQVLPGSITDPSQINNTVLTVDVAPGQQVQLQDFAVGNPTLSSYLTGTARAIALSTDSIHGLSGYLVAGDHVDLFVSSAGVVTVLQQNVDVLVASASEIVVRVTDKVALQLAQVNDTAKFWFVLRPPVGAQQSIAPGQRAG